MPSQLNLFRAPKQSGVFHAGDRVRRRGNDPRFPDGIYVVDEFVPAYGFERAMVRFTHGLIRRDTGERNYGFYTYRVEHAED